MHRTVRRPEELSGGIERILIPTDGSEGARRGVDHALELAERSGATVHVLFVVDERLVGGTPALSSEELAIEKRDERGEEVCREVASTAERRGIEAVTCCLRGLPHEAIQRYAEANDVDLIVMGLHGQSKDAPPRIGSTTDRVLRTSGVPVMSV